MNSDVSLYFHFPFCSKKCNYCDFYSEPNKNQKIINYIDALELELKNYTEYLESSKIKTIYCGGGTPSILSTEQWVYFSKKILSKLNYNSNTEFTIECNPDSFTSEKAEHWLNTGVNRVSIGIQSFNNNELKLMGRVHDSNQVDKVLSNKILSNFNSVNGDLIFGIPEQTLDSFKKSLTTLFSYEIINHFSSYELTIAPNTAFDKNRDKLIFPSEIAIENLTNLLSEISERYGFTQYEISNFSKPNFECQHNINYWNYSNYIGFGSSSHSFIFPYRFANISDTKKYISLLNNGRSSEVFREKISGVSLVFELLFLGLRTSTGVNIPQFEELTDSIFFTNEREKNIESLINKKLITVDNDFLKPTKKGLLFADGIVQKLI